MSEGRVLPYVGAVIRYGYLWRDEARRGARTPRKDRPCLILAAAVTDDGVRVYVAPITRTKPEPARAIELSRAVRRRLGLDVSIPSWLIVDEANHFLWRGVDVVAASPGRDHFGMMSDTIVREAKARFVAGVRGGGVRSTDRESR